MIKTFLKNELALALWVGVNGGYITTEEYIDMMQLQNLSDGSEYDKEMALESENIEFQIMKDGMKTIVVHIPKRCRKPKMDIFFPDKVPNNFLVTRLEILCWCHLFKVTTLSQKSATS